MNEGTNEKRRGAVRIHLQSIVKALYGSTDYKAINMRIDRYDNDILVITVDHPSLPISGKGYRYPIVNIKRTPVNEEEHEG